MLAEVLIGVVLIITAVAPVATMVSTSSQLRKSESERFLALLAAQNVMEELRAMPPALLPSEIGSEVGLRWSCDPGHTVRAVAKEIHRSASRRHVPVELTMSAGGRIYARAMGPDSVVEADQPYLHVFLEAESVPLPGTGTGLTASVRFPARVETLGQFLKRQLLVFAHNWRTL